MVAREWFEGVRRSAGALESCQRQLSALLDAQMRVEPWGIAKGGGGKASHSDPTATAAQSRMEGLESAIADERRKIDTHTEIVGEGLKVLEVVRVVVGERHATALELYYVDCAETWSDVACDMGLSRETVRAMRDAALRWVDAHVKLA